MICHKSFKSSLAPESLRPASPPWWAWLLFPLAWLVTKFRRGPY